MTKKMTIKEIEDYLTIKHISFDDDVSNEIEQLRQNAILEQDEKQANYCWCLREVYRIKKDFVSAFINIKNNKYEDAWCLFDYIDINLSNLENNFDISADNDRYQLLFIKRMVKEYQKLFPYTLFFSRENIIKKEECTICGKAISLRNPCGHKVGKLYMGELCLRRVTDMEMLAFCIVEDPFDKYALLTLPEHEYNYGMLEELMLEIDSPYDIFSVETVKVKNPKYKGIGRNEQCPCGSGKKYKCCHQGTENELMNHHIVHLSKPIKRTNKYVGVFNTWK